MHDQLIDTLRQDHQEVKQIFSALLDTDQPSRREELVEQLHREILPHMRAEERVIYPSLREHCQDCREEVLESLEEHHAARLVLNELEELAVDNERFRAKTMVLKEMVEHHLREEEKDLFEEMRKNLSEGQAKEILGRFQQEKQRIKERIH
ncbi:MAG: hemerythrin domain-containing protein [Desulfuromonadales bacterium]|nr:hemerythrin domain-containing protein [Desulfuromonadales bacterium]